MWRHSTLLLVNVPDHVTTLSVGHYSGTWTNMLLAVFITFGSSQHDIFVLLTRSMKEKEFVGEFGL